MKNFFDALSFGFLVAIKLAAVGTIAVLLTAPSFGAIVLLNTTMLALFIVGSCGVGLLYAIYKWIKSPSAETVKA